MLLLIHNFWLCSFPPSLYLTFNKHFIHSFEFFLQLFLTDKVRSIGHLIKAAVPLLGRLLRPFLVSLMVFRFHKYDTDDSWTVMCTTILWTVHIMCTLTNVVLEFLYFVVTVRQFYSINHLIFILFKIFVQNSKPRIVQSSVMFLPPEIILEN